ILVAPPPSPSLFPFTRSPDLTRLWVTATQDEEKPNLEVIVLNPDGTENCSVYMMAHAETRAETTLHMRNPAPGSTYRVVAEMSQGVGDAQRVLDRHEFDLVLAFRNPDAGGPGFGFGVDWDDIARKAGSA